MEYNVIGIYTNFIQSKLLELFKILLKYKYNRSVCLNFIDRYIDVRYYNETNYPKEKDFIQRLNRELVDVYNQNVDDDNKDVLKNIVALFGYITYLDDLYNIVEDVEVIHTLVTDENLKFDKTDELEDKIKEWYLSFNKGKNNFQNAISSKEFCITEKSVYRKLHEVTLNHNVKVSNLYSEYAINKAFNSGVVNEDKEFITYILTSQLVLNSAINLDFSYKYVVPFSESYYSKEKKAGRLLNILNNPLAKKLINIKIYYSNYLENKEFINGLIKQGYSFALVLDNELQDLNELVLFTYIYVFEDSNNFDIIVSNKDKLGIKVIKV
jgi:hypothetical protein